MIVVERRKNRSSKVYPAIQKQLQAVARDGHFRTALYIDRDGLVIAASHEHPLNDTLAIIGSRYLTDHELLETYRDKTFVLKNRLGSQSIIGHLFYLLEQPVLFLAVATRTSVVTPLVARAVEGAKRILGD